MYYKDPNYLTDRLTFNKTFCGENFILWFWLKNHTFKQSLIFNKSIVYRFLMTVWRACSSNNVNMAYFIDWHIH